MLNVIPYYDNKTIKNIEQLTNVDSNPFTKDFDHHLQGKYCDENKIGNLEKIIKRFGL